MSGSLDAEWLGVGAVNEVLDVGSRWGHGRVISIHAQRIGADFGFSGRVYRLDLGARSNGPASIVAKIEDAEGIARAVAFRDQNEALLAGHIPVSFGARIDRAEDRGLILLEDVCPATQGNDATGCTTTQARTIVRLVAMLHASTWTSGNNRPADSSVVWAERDWDQARWNDRLTRAVLRFPGDLDAVTLARLSDFPAEAANAHDGLTQGSRAWVHRDPHPDNALWRLDGRLVMLDWSNAMIAPPAIDVAVLLFSLSFRLDAALSAEAVLTAYCAALSDNGLDPDGDEICYNAAAAVRLMIRGSIGWAGNTAVPDTSARMLELQAQAVARAKSALRWLEEQLACTQISG